MTAADRPRAAIVHDWFQGFHGSERVVEALRELLAAGGRSPDVYTFHAAREVLPPRLAEAIVRDSALARLRPLRQREHGRGRWRYLLPYMPLYFRGLDLDPYDVVVSSTHAFAHHVRPRASTVHVCYCHTPIRYGWLPSVDRRPGIAALALRPARPALRALDRRAAARPDSFVANSTSVRDRIRRFYGRDAVVVHPPVDVQEFDYRRPKRPGHFVWAQRLVPYKRPHEVVEAFRRLPYTLTMVGVGPEERRLRASLPSNVELRSWVERRELVRLFEEASGFVHLGEEDFGISMVEALAAGVPVVGLARGGALDIVRRDVDGVLVDSIEPAVVAEAVERLATTAWDAEALAARAAAFSPEVFADRFRAHLMDLGVDVRPETPARSAGRRRTVPRHGR